MSSMDSSASPRLRFPVASVLSSFGGDAASSASSSALPSWSVVADGACPRGGRRGPL